MNVVHLRSYKIPPSTTEGTCFSDPLISGQSMSPKRTSRDGGEMWELIIRYLIISCEYTIFYIIVSLNDYVQSLKYNRIIFTKCTLFRLYLKTIPSPSHLCLFISGGRSIRWGEFILYRILVNILRI